MMTVYKKILALLNRMSSIPFLLLRLSLGTVFVLSGWGKFHNLDKVTSFFMELGIPYPSVQAHLVSGVEFFGGILLLLGLATRLAAIPLAVTMVVALVTAKRAEITGLTDLLTIEEFLYLCVLLLFVFNGARNFSADFYLSKIEHRGRR